MSKKSILSTLLISSALLGTATAANAATSAVKPEKKLVSVEKSNAKIYKNSKLQESKTVKKGTVYKVDGYRNINSKKYYRVYQEDTKGKVVYKGYILDKDTKVLKGQKPAKADRLVALTKDDQTAWKNLYFNKKIKTYDGTKHSSNFEVKYSYNIGGKKYFSLYRGEKWMGYMDGSAFKVLTPENVEESQQDYEVVKDYDTYSDIYFTENGQLKVGEKVKVKRIYTFGTGRQYGSLYDKDGKWIGYANMKALQAIKDTTPEKPDTKPEPDKPGTGGSTGDSGSGDTGNKPGDSGTGDSGSGSHPGSGDQGSSGDSGTGDSGSGDTGNTPGEGGTGDSGSGSQPGGGDQGGSGDTGTGGGTGTPEQPTESELDKAKKEAKEAIDKAEKELKEAKATNASKEAAKKVIEEAKKTLEGDKLEDIKQIPSKVDKAIKDLQPLASEEETKSLDKAISDAEKVVENKDALNGVDKVEKALEEAKKVKEAAGKGDAGQKEVANATKAVNDAIKEITLKPSKNKESIEKLHAAIEKLKETQKLGADNLINNEKYNEVLTSAEKVLENAVAGKVGKEAIDAETEKVNNFINGLKLNTKALEDKINDIKAEGDKVYMTQDQESKFNKFIEDAKAAAANKDLSNTEKLQEIDTQLKQAEDFIKGQPTKEDVQKLIDATKKEQEVEEQLKGKENDVFQNWNTVTEKDTAADTMLDEIKKDKSSSDNTAEKPYTAKEVQDAAKALMDSMANLEVNHTNLQKYDQAAKAAIKELDEVHKEKAEELLRNFEVAAEDASVKYLNQMVNAANKLNKEIHDDQVQEINDVIEKAKRIEGVNKSKEDGQSAPNAKFYESGSYEAMNNALDAAEKAEQKLKGEKVASRSKRAAEVGATQVQNGKEAARTEKELKEKINALQVKDWTVSEDEDGVIKLTKYTGDYTSTADSKQKDGNTLIEIPGSLKDKQVVVDNSHEEQLFPEYKNTDGQGTVEIKFEQNGGRKVKAGEDLYASFYLNKKIKTIDFEGLDTLNVKRFTATFSNDFFLSDLKNEESLVTASTISMEDMFSSTGLNDVDATHWDTSNVTDMSNLFDGSKVQSISGLENWDVTKVTKFAHIFGGTRRLTKVNLSNWNMENATKDDVKLMFMPSKYAPKQTGLEEITLPNEFHGSYGMAPQWIVEGLQDVAKKKKLANDVIVKKSDGTKIGTIKKDTGKWENESTQEGETIVSDEVTLKNAPKLARAIISSPKASQEAKDLAEIVDAGYKVSENSTGNEEKSISKIDINKAWTDFGGSGKGSYYDALGDLQNYARNTTSVTKEKLQKDAEELVDDMEDLRVLPDYLDKAMKEAQKAEASAKSAHVEGSEVETTEDLIADAKVIVEGKNDARRKLDNWTHINELTAKLKEAAKKLTTIVKK